jgi:hypothetical protein
MKRLLTIVSFALLASLGGCVSGVTVREIAYEQIDLPDRGAIEIRYRNKTNANMCFLPESWPNSVGGIADADKTAFLVVGSQRFAMRLFNAGYCIKGCSTLVKPGQDLVTRIPYEFFDLPRELTQQPKHLEFTARAYLCDRN